jgi:hypothetical protein
MECPQEDLALVIIHLTVHKGRQFIQTDREMYIRGHSKAATGKKERTGPGHRLITPDPKFRISMLSK